MKMKAIVVGMMLLLVGAGVTAGAAPTVGFSESKIRSAAGQTITVDIVMTGFPTTEGGGLTLTFNPDVVQVIGVELNAAAWSFATRDGIVDNANGRISDLLFSSLAGVAGDALIATVTLETIATGRSRLKLVESQLNPFASGGELLDMTLTDSVIRVRNNGRRNRSR